MNLTSRAPGLGQVHMFPAFHIYDVVGLDFGLWTVSVGSRPTSFSELAVLLQSLESVDCSSSVLSSSPTICKAICNCQSIEISSLFWKNSALIIT